MTCGEGKDGVERSARSRASAKRTVRGIGEAVEVDGMLRDRGGGVLQAKRLRLTVCSRAGGGSMLWVKRSRAKRSRQWHAPGVGSVEELKRASGEKLLSVEWATRALDIYIGARCTTRVH
jgi:hypothetical protein